MSNAGRLWQILAWLVLGTASASARADVPVAEAPSLLQLRAAFGIGVHSRSFQRPTDTGTKALPTAYAPALECSFGVVVWPDADFALAIGVSYQTGLWLTVSELPPFALANEVSVRSQRLALNVAPSWRMGAGSRIGFALGGTIRSFWPSDRALQTPRYNLIGPHARAELVAALLGPLRVRVTPELQWLVLIDAQSAPTQGAAIGGELALELVWAEGRTLALGYRESHALLARAARFQDVERYLTLRIEEAF